MTWLVLTSVLAGLLVGRFTDLGALEGAYFERTTTAALCVLLVCVGVEVGAPGDHWKHLRRLGARGLLVPLAVAVGSIAGPLLLAPLLGLPLPHAAVVGSGFGWYSLTGVLLTQLHSAELGALGFLSNVLRELLAFVAIPLLATRLGPLPAIAPGGATAMDTTLPVIQRAAGSTAAILAFLTGCVLSATVPILMPLLTKLCP